MMRTNYLIRYATGAIGFILIIFYIYRYVTTDKLEWYESWIPVLVITSGIMVFVTENLMNKKK